MYLKFFSAILLLFVFFQVSALSFPLPAEGNDIVGQVKQVRAEVGDSFTTIARRYDVGYYELVEANPGIDPDFIAAGQKMLIPSRYILPPKAKRHGVVINVAELRLYYFPRDGKTVVTEPVGIGRIGWETPIGKTSIEAMAKNPTWYSPKSVRDFRAKQGVIIPKVVKPGPDNPLGPYAIRLAWPGYLIHGTNDPTGVGRRVSSGCIRMYNEDIERLFQEVRVGTPIEVIDSPYKLGWQNNQLYLEAHVPLKEDSKHHYPVVDAVADATMLQDVEIDWGEVQRLGEERSGIPTVISRTLLSQR